MSKDKKTPMIAMMGEKELTIGEATPAQVRILTRKGHAKLVNGKLVVEIRPLMLQFGEQLKDDTHITETRTITDDAGNVIRQETYRYKDPTLSDAEIERRWQWFTRILGATVEHSLHPTQTDPRNNLNHILAANEFAPGAKGSVNRILTGGGIDDGEDFVVGEDGTLKIIRVNAPPESQQNLTGQDLEWYTEAVQNFDRASAAWESAPDVYGHSGSNMREYSGVRFGSAAEQAAFVEAYQKELAEDQAAKVAEVKFTKTWKRPIPEDA